MKTHISHSFDFRADGNATDIQVFGWSIPEPHHTWSTGKRSVLAIDNVVAPYGYFLEIDWHPFIAHPYRPDQSVTITVLDHQIRPYCVTQHEVAAFYCPPPSGPDKRVLITFDQPDSSKITDFFDTKDTRQVAIAFRRLRILPLLERPPVRLRNYSDCNVMNETRRLNIPPHLDTHSSDLQSLFGQFEMLAGNCDLGLAMRALGAEQLSLLRFSGATPEVAIRGLENNFHNIGEQLSTEVADNPIKEWMVRDAFGLRFHTHQSSETTTEADILKRQRLHIQFLRRKFLEDIEFAEKIFIYADHLRPRTVESALALFLALRRKGKHRMLWVCPNVSETTPGRVDELFSGFARGSLDVFGGPLEAGHIAVSGWVNVLFNASVVFNRANPV